MVPYNRAIAVKSCAIASYRQQRSKSLSPPTSLNVAALETDKTPPHTPMLGKLMEILGRKWSAPNGAEHQELYRPRNIRVQGLTGKGKVEPAIEIESTRPNVIEPIHEHVIDKDDNKTKGDKKVPNSGKANKFWELGHGVLVK